MGSVPAIDRLYCCELYYTPPKSFTGRYFSYLAKQNTFKASLLSSCDRSHTCLGHIAYRICILLLRGVATFGACFTVIADLIWSLKMITFHRKEKEMGLSRQQPVMLHVGLTFFRIFALACGYIPAVERKRTGIYREIYARRYLILVSELQKTKYALKSDVDYTPATGLSPLCEFTLSGRYINQFSEHYFHLYFISLIFAGAVFDGTILKASQTWMNKVSPLLLNPQYDKTEKLERLRNLYPEIESGLPPTDKAEAKDEAEARGKTAAATKSPPIEYRWNFPVALKGYVVTATNFLQPDGQFPGEIPEDIMRISLHLSQYAERADDFTRAAVVAKQRRVTILAGTPDLWMMPQGLLKIIADYWNGFLTISPEEAFDFLTNIE